MHTPKELLLAISIYWSKSVDLNSIELRKNIVISPNILVWKFCGKLQFPHSFGRFTQNYAKTEPFHKISTPGS